MTLNQLNYVIAIAEYGSMNKAAEYLYVAQPSLSGAVKSLEDELGFALFNRNGRGVSLTADGADFLPYAREIYSSYENMRERFCNGVGLKKKFGVSTQHYSFAAKAFIEMVKFYDTSEYEFAIRETMTKDIINQVLRELRATGLAPVMEDSTGRLILDPTPATPGRRAPAPTRPGGEYTVRRRSPSPRELAALVGRLRAGEEERRAAGEPAGAATDPVHALALLRTTDRKSVV